jgi:hypothetical protein
MHAPSSIILEYLYAICHLCRVNMPRNKPKGGLTNGVSKKTRRGCVALVPELL